MFDAELEVDRRKKIVLSLVRKEYTIAEIIGKHPQCSERELNELEAMFLQAGVIAISKHSLLQVLGHRIKSIIVLSFVVLAAACFCAGFVFAVVNRPDAQAVSEADNTPSWSRSANIGQFIEGHLATGATIASALLLFIAIWLQHDELKEQRNELTLARKDSERQLAAAQEAALVNQVLQCAQLRFETERRHLLDEVAAKRRDPYEILDLEVKQLSHIDRVSDELFERHHLPDDLRKVLRVLASGEQET